jgi:DNA mismatch endonuclease (patch repair protein)
MKSDGRPTASSPAALKRMRSARQRDTGPEVSLRRCLHASGLRFRVNRPILPGMMRRADVLFASAKVAVFVDGCFWHCCPVHRTFPKANATWWAEKLRTNRARDLDTNRRLMEAGWHVERVWEHESPSVAAARIVAAVRRRTPHQDTRRQLLRPSAVARRQRA